MEKEQKDLFMREGEAKQEAYVEARRVKREEWWAEERKRLRSLGLNDNSQPLTTHPA